MLTSNDPSIVTTREELERVAGWVADAPLIAVDTEFVREKTYYPKLCLIQLGTDSHATCIDCLAPLDLSAVLDPLFATERTWVLHSARQDLEVIWQLAGQLPPRLIDTQVAAGLLGYAPQIGLEGLLRTALDVELGESYARTDWRRRPLPAEALEYALDDVRYLLPAWRTLESRLDELGRSAWLEEDCARLLAEPPIADATAVWSRLKGVHALAFDARCAALSLVRWRELTAQHKDRPRRWILADEELLSIATALPSDKTALERCAAPRTVAKFGDVLIAAVTDRSEGQIQDLVRSHQAAPMPDRATLKALQAAVRQRAQELGVEPEIIATRRDLAVVANGERPAALGSGWRAEVLADTLWPREADSE